MPTHVNYDNMYSLLSGVIGNLKSKINAIDLTDQQKLQLSIIDKIVKTGDGTKYLSDNGTYKNIPLDQMNNMTNELSVIYDLLKVSYSKGDVWNTNYNTMATNRGYFGRVEYNGKVYCIGGYSNNGFLNKVEVYDIASNTWSTNYNNMPTSRSDFGCVEYNGKIYCIGGGNNTGYLNKVEVYDIASNTWSTNYNNMPTNRNNFGCVEYNGKVYCIGGNNGGYLNKVEVYDILSNTWSTNYNNMPTGRAYFGCIEYNNKIYCIGGYGVGVGFLNKVEVYQLQLTSYDITLPSDISNKLSLLITNGTGNKLLTDNGTYQEYIPSGYREMNSDEMNTLVNFINTSF